MKKREENLLAKIANLLEKPLEEVKEIKSVYSTEEQILEAQSVSNFYHWRKSLERRKGESERLWQARLNEWKYKTCAGCEERFAYSYAYDGIKFCSLDCLKGDLAKNGIALTPYRPLNLRWGYRYPGIVPSSALKSVEHSLDSDALEHSDHEE